MQTFQGKKAETYQQLRVNSYRHSDGQYQSGIGDS